MMDLYVFFFFETLVTIKRAPKKTDKKFGGILKNL
jgi:hypothetical protein